MTNPTERSLSIQEDSSPQTSETLQTAPTPEVSQNSQEPLAIGATSLTSSEITQQFQYHLTQLELFTQSIDDTLAHLNRLITELNSTKEVSL